MKKRGLRVLAGVLALLMVFGCVSSTVPAYGAEAEAKQEKVLTVTQDMVAENGRLTISGEWDMIIVPKEIEASRIIFRDVKTQRVEIESGNKSKFEMTSGEFGEVAVVPAKLEEMTVQELAELIRLTEDSGAAIAQYKAQKEQNAAYLAARPTLVTGKNATVNSLNVSGNVKLDLGRGAVEAVKVDADGSQKELNVNISNYEGNVAVKQTEREDGSWMIARVKLNNTKVEELTVEGEGRGNIVLSGQRTEVKEVKVESASTLTLNVPTEKVAVEETAKEVKLSVLTAVKEMQVAASDTRIEVGNCGSVESANVDGNNVQISGEGAVADVEIKGEGVAVSTQGTKVEGENVYIPPVVVAPSEPVEPPKEEETGLLYEELKNGTIRIVGGKDDTIESIVIPAEIGGKKVTEIGEDAFSTYYSLKEVTLPDGLLVINNSAFYFCRELEKIVIPESVQVIGEMAFAFCGLTEVTVPKNVKELGAWAFGGCDDLSYIHVAEDNPSYVSVDGVVYNKEKTELVLAPTALDAERYEILPGTKVLKEECFRQCTKIQTIVMPASLETIEMSAIYICYALKAIEVAEENPLYTSVDGVLFSKDMKVLISMPQEKEGTLYIVPEGVEEIGEDAFFWTGFEEVIISEGVKVIGRGAFFNGRNLTTVILPESLEEIGVQGFGCCRKLENVVLPSGLSELAWYAFQECDVLDTMEIPYSVTEMYAESFEGCDNLTELVIPKTVEKIWGEFVDCPLLTLTVEKGSYADTYAQEKGLRVTYIKVNEFLFVETDAGEIAITGYKTLASDFITLPDQIEGKTVTAVSGGAFSGCTTITMVRVSEEVTEIGAEAFADCPNLEFVYIPGSVTVIAEDAFKNSGSGKLVLSSVAGSYAEEYAERHGIPIHTAW